MVFVRVAVCPIRCRYCDTPNSYEVPETFVLRRGSDEESHDNPVSAEFAARLASELAADSPWGPITWVSLTGGEPLLYPGFVAEFGAALRASGLRLMLETAALDAASWRQCQDAVDHLSADYKLPGTLGRGDAEAAGRACAECVAAASAAGCTVDVKMVLTGAVPEEAFARALVALLPRRGSFQLILQPVTPDLEVCQPLAFWGRAARRLRLLKRCPGSWRSYIWV